MIVHQNWYKNGMSMLTCKHVKQVQLHVCLPRQVTSYSHNGILPQNNKRISCSIPRFASNYYSFVTEARRIGCPRMVIIAACKDSFKIDGKLSIKRFQMVAVTEISRSGLLSSRTHDDWDLTEGDNVYFNGNVDACRPQENLYVFDLLVCIFLFLVYNDTIILCGSLLTILRTQQEVFRCFYLGA